MGSLLSVESSLCTSLLCACTGLLASEEQKQELLPGMAQLKLIGAWGLTEPSNGSDASALQTTARKVGGSRSVEWSQGSCFMHALRSSLR